MANLIYATITGSQQGLISSGCSTFDSIGNKWQANHENEIFIYELTCHLERHDNVSFHPVEIRKPIDKSTPLLTLALNDNEKLECEFLFHRISESGGLEPYFKIKLTDAMISEIHSYYPNSLTHNEIQPQESISFKYKTITWEHIKAGTSAYCIWENVI